MWNSQLPTPNPQKTPKSQIQKVRCLDQKRLEVDLFNNFNMSMGWALGVGILLGFGCWDFIGIWDLGFGSL